MKCKQFKTAYFTTLFLIFFGYSFSANGQSENINAGEVILARVFGNHMVLQQNKPITIWGAAASGTKIVAQLGEETRQVLSDENGNWLLTFSPLEASFEPLLLKVNDLRIEDILVGEVWLCSGQSNMQFLLKNIDTYDSIQSYTSSNSLRIFRHKNIRIVATKGYSKSELARCNINNFFEAKWELSSKQSAAQSSAIAWLFGHGIQNKLNVPIGIIQVAVGGSSITNWTPPEALKTNPSTASLFQLDWLSNEHVKLAHRQRASDAFQNVLKPDEPYIIGETPYRWLCEPGFLFDAGIAPLQHLSFKGVLWYQGESDTDNLESVASAKELYPLMITEWRSFFNQGNFPFIAIQLPAFKGEFWPDFREVQRQTIHKFEQAYMVVSIDLGAEKNIHPKDKQLIGERSAHLALKNVYGFNQLVGFPVLDTWKVHKQKITLCLKEYGAGMYSKNDTIAGFEVAGEDGVFQKTIAFLSSENKLKVVNPVKEPLQLRYAWMPFPKPSLSLYNSENLPLQPFVIHIK